MSVEIRTALRNNVIETLKQTFPNAQPVVGGVAFYSDVVDEETGLLFPVEIKVAIKNTKPTAHADAYNLEDAIAKAASRPGRRTADPEKKAAEAAKKAEATARKEANISILRNWVNNGNLKGNMLASEVKNSVPEFENVMTMQVGTYLLSLVKEGLLAFEIDEKKRKQYHTI